MKKILNKIGKVLQVVLAAPVKWPGKAGDILKYIALGLGIVHTVLEEDKPPPEEAELVDGEKMSRQGVDTAEISDHAPVHAAKLPAAERSGSDENQ